MNDEKVVGWVSSMKIDENSKTICLLHQDDEYQYNV